MTRIPYDEFSMFKENAEEWALPYSHPPAVERLSVAAAPQRHVSGLRWGSGAPQLILLHGAGQNAHTFDTLAIALARPLLALDLPGHGHSDAAPGGNGDVAGHARDVAAVLAALGIAHVAVVGMSLGGLVGLLVDANQPILVDRLALVDVTPGVTDERAPDVTRFVAGPGSFDDLDELVARTRDFAPHRSEQSIRRGVLHNALQREDGTWVWRHQRFDPPDEPVGMDPTSLWAALSGLAVPLLLVRGLAAGSLVNDEDEHELLRRQPGARVARIAGAGHAVQSDQPIELARHLHAFLDA